jgi:methyl-accepting chemotaxis protein
MIVTNLVYMLLIVTVTFAILLSPLISDMVSSDNIEIQYQAAQTFLTLLKRFIPAVFAMFVLIFLHQISFTHRICGPLVNFGYTFHKISEGDLTRKISLRKGDYLQKECDQINEMQDNLIDQIATARTDTDKLILFLEGLMDRVEDIDSRTKIHEVLNSVKQEAVMVKKDLSVFRTEEMKTEGLE